MRDLSACVEAELQKAGAVTATQTFHHLERAHVLSQYRTSDHVKVHWRMLRWAAGCSEYREVFGQVVRIIGALTKTWIGFVPLGNTGGTNVSAFRSMPLPADLDDLIRRHRKR